MIPALLCSAYVIFLYYKLKKERTVQPEAENDDQFSALLERMKGLEERLSRLSHQPGKEG